MPAGTHAPVYYEFQHQPNFLKYIKLPHVKADHGDESSFVFGSSFWGRKGKFSSFSKRWGPDEENEVQREDRVRCAPSYSSKGGISVRYECRG
jgi:hypothetical protein